MLQKIKIGNLTLSAVQIALIKFLDKWDHTYFISDSKADTTPPLLLVLHQSITDPNFYIHWCKYQLKDVKTKLECCL